MENESNPSGITLVHSDRTNVAADPNDIVELAKIVKKVRMFCSLHSTIRINHKECRTGPVSKMEIGDDTVRVVTKLVGTGRARPALTKTDQH